MVFALDNQRGEHREVRGARLTGRAGGVRGSNRRWQPGPVVSQLKSPPKRAGGKHGGLGRRVHGSGRHA